MVKALVLPFLLFAVLIESAHGEEAFNWSTFDSLLQTHIKAGSYQGINANLVNYPALINDQQFSAIGQALSRYNPTDLLTADKLAFYINAYNYYAIKIVADNWPVEGIKDIGGLLRPVWKKTVGKINGQTVTLNQIEHQILRPIGEPRVHFAIVCSSMSCPDLRPEVFTAGKLDRQLDEQTRAFLMNPSKGSVIDDGELYLSEIFDWFEEDFAASGGIYEFIARYRKELVGFDDFETLDYNWELNAQRN